MIEVKVKEDPTYYLGNVQWYSCFDSKNNTYVAIPFMQNKAKTRVKLLIDGKNITATQFEKYCAKFGEFDKKNIKSSYEFFDATNSMGAVSPVFILRSAYPKDINFYKLKQSKIAKIAGGIVNNLNMRRKMLLNEKEIQHAKEMAKQNKINVDRVF